MGNVGIAIVLAIAGLFIPVPVAPQLIGSLIGGLGWLTLWAVWVAWQRYRAKSYPRWDYPSLQIDQQHPPTLDKELARFAIRAEVCAEGFKVYQDSTTIDKVELLWTSYPLIAPCRVLYRFHVQSIISQSEEVSLPATLFYLGKVRLQFYFNASFEPGIHERPPKHGRLVIAITVAGQERSTVIANIDTNGWEHPKVTLLSTQNKAVSLI